MKKTKIKKLSLFELKDQFYTFSESEQRQIVAGTNPQEYSWDCMFNSFIDCYQREYGISIDKGEMVNLYMMHSGRDPQAEGGADVASFIQVMALYGISGSFEGTPSLEENKTMIGVKARDENNNVIENNLHFLIPEYVKRDENGKVTHIICRDPTKNNSDVECSLDDVVGYLNLSELPVYAGSDGSFGSGSGSSWSA